jgi:hypothetical protein
VTAHPARLAWSACGLSLVLAALGFLFMGLNRTQPDGPVFGYWAENAALALAFPTVGALVAARRSGNPIGWIFIATGLAGAAVLLCSEYALYALYTAPGELPAGRVMAWLSAWLGTVSFALAFAFLFLLFPDGRLLSSRWRPVAWLAAATMAVSLLVSAFKPQLTDEAGQAVPNGAPSVLENPIGLDGAGSLLDALEGTAILVFVVFCALPAAASLILRYRRSRGEQRQQIKWLAYAAGALVAGVFVIPDVLKAISGETDAVMTAQRALEAAPIAGIPIATGIAILRHRLYDIDVVIRRTLVYAALSGTLIASYLAGVLLLQLALDPLTEDSDLAIAGSTLAVASLFRPARRRIQALVDRRFYRRKYDAARTVESFGARVRNEVELDALASDLREVVTDTMQPTHLSLWLREAPR